MNDDLPQVQLSPEVINDLRRKMAEIEEQRKFPAPPLHNFELGEYVCRSMWNRIFTRPKGEHLHEFIYHAMFWVFGDHWYKAEKEKAKKDQHVIIQWDQARYDFLSRLQKEGHPMGQLVIPTGEVRELISLAADMYYLQLVNELPKNLIARLRSIDGFQGARYEIAVAASMVRAGFSVRWKNERTSATKIYEFDAFQSYTNETLAIEAKSRRRPGTLNQKGSLPDFSQIHLDIFGLYNDAIRQKPKDRSFGVFIDMNLPRWPTCQVDWKNEVFTKLQRESESFFGTNVPTFLALTNCAWHYDGEQTASPEEFLLIFPNSANIEHPIKNEITRQTVVRSLERFSKIPEEILK